MLSRKPRTVGDATNMLRNNQEFLNKLQELRHDPKYSLIVNHEEVKAILDKLKKKTDEEDKEIVGLEIK